MKVKLFIILGIVLGLVVLAAGIFWYLSMQPLYRPGMVRDGQNLRASLTPPQQSGDPSFWQVENDIRLYHFSQGTGRDVLVIHGGPGLPFRQPLPGLEPLADRYRFTFYDQRGCGQSTRPFDRFTSQNMYANMTELDKTLGLGAQIADIERIRRILGDEKLILVGHSWGGFLASLYAAEFPEHVAALILVSPANTLVMPSPDQDSDLFTSVRLRLPEGQRAGYDAFMKDYMDFNKLFTRSEAELVAMNQKFGEYYVSVGDFPTGMQLKQGEPGGWMVWAMYVSMGQSHDYRPALKQVTAPVLVIHGAKDLQSEAASYAYVKAFPNAQFAVIPDATHFSFVEQPEAFARVVGNFLDQLK